LERDPEEAEMGSGLGESGMPASGATFLRFTSMTVATAMATMERTSPVPMRWRWLMPISVPVTRRAKWMMAWS